MANQYIGTIPSDPNPLADALKGAQQGIERYNQGLQRQQERERKEVEAIMDFAQNAYGSKAYGEVINRIERSPEMIEKIEKYRPEFLRKREDGSGYTINVPEPEGFKRFVDETPQSFAVKTPTGEIKTIKKPKELVEGDPDNYSVQFRDNQLLVMDITSGEPELKRRVDVTNENLVRNTLEDYNLDKGTVTQKLINAKGETIGEYTTESPQLSEWQWNKKMDKKQIDLQEEEMEQRKEEADRQYSLDVARVNLQKQQLEQSLKQLGLEEAQLAADYRNLRFRRDQETGEIIGAIGERYNPDSGEWVTKELSGMPRALMNSYLQYQQLKQEQKKAGTGLPSDPKSLALMAGNQVQEITGGDPVASKSPNVWKNAINSLALTKVQASDKLSSEQLPLFRAQILYEAENSGVLPYQVKQQGGQSIKVPQIRPNQILDGDALREYQKLREERGIPQGSKDDTDNNNVTTTDESDDGMFGETVENVNQFFGSGVDASKQLLDAIMGGGSNDNSSVTEPQSLRPNQQQQNPSVSSALRRLQQERNDNIGGGLYG